tara:strand:- start:17 stop:334 length:318 start_codon:yes stop_codon:yes gene_type:complete
MILAPKGNSGFLGRKIAEDLHLKLAVLTDSELSCSSDGEFALDSGEDATTETDESLKQVIIKLLAIMHSTTKQLQATSKQLDSVSNVIKNLENELHVNRINNHKR